MDFFAWRRLGVRDRMGPRVKARGAHRKRHPAKRRIKIGKEHAPGNAIHGQVMNGDGERAAFGNVGVAKQRPLQTQRALQRDRVAEKFEGTRRGSQRFLKDLPPAVPSALVAQAEDGMRRYDLREGRCQLLARHGSVEDRRERLIPMVRLREIVREEPALNGGQWHFAGRGLFGEPRDGRLAAGGVLSQRRNGGMIEKLLWRQIQSA